MSDFSVEKRLELVKQVRSKYYENQSDMMNREQILYGKTSPRTLEASYQTQTQEEGIFKDGTLKIRYALAAVALITIVLLDKSDQSFAGISMDKVFSVIEKDYEEMIEAWVTVSDSTTQIPPSE